MKSSKTPAILSPSLERTVLAGMAKGVVPLDAVAKTQLTTDGQWLHAAILELRKKRSEVALTDVLHLAEHHGGDPDTLRTYVKKMSQTEASASTADVLRAINDRQSLVDLMNEISRQMSGEIDRAALLEHLRVEREEEEEDPSLYSEEEEKAPSGPDIYGFPRLTEATGGMFGLWMIAGDPGSGKSTFALQIAALAAGGHDWPVAYCDAENSKGVMRYRLQQQLPGKKHRSQYTRAAKRITYVDMRGVNTTLIAWMQQHKRGLIVIDPLQKLPTKIDHKRESVDAWLKRFEDWAKDGYMVIAVSEKDRSTYGKASSRGFKESGEIEYSGWVNWQLVSGRLPEDPVNVHFTKNRHRPTTGHIIDLVRDEERPLWFREREGGTAWNERKEDE